QEPYPKAGSVHNGLELQSRNGHIGGSGL
ncbi:MAG: hypothetical protein K0Q70_1724, partial [Rhodospirillales bacterium]|nr:hypothetical protein [Rhodospirillales bacterium]